ncbi:LytR/AlgR family response regulator transcription factor [Marinoscillum furvescens]|uniref:LytTR family two component transcriptional regulator n=1 Tax=Marinoscillum furvescens DSM 4134 TaxID=1122208 RepID=A0A3D9L6V6_MARFU|nr:response regulator [Marinoscillum furvescens]REE00461.1 LytTR family two component transcriptional regulator [Marinoscillum furvescens DSM 4134]
MNDRAGYQILVVDDEEAIGAMCSSLLNELGYAVVGIAASYDQAVRAIDEKQPDLVILDIDLGDSKNGIDLADHINETTKTPFLYLSSYADISTVSKAAKTIPQAYLIKPFTKEDLFTTIEIVRNKNKTDQTIQISSGTSTIKISANDVSLIKSDNNYIEIFENGKRHIVRSSLDAFLKEQEYDNFVRIHRSYAINLLKVDSFSRQHVIVGNHKCPISRSYKQELMQRFS